MFCRRRRGRLGISCKNRLATVSLLLLTTIVALALAGLAPRARSITLRGSILFQTTAQIKAPADTYYTHRLTYAPPQRDGDTHRPNSPHWSGVLHHSQPHGRNTALHVSLVRPTRRLSRNYHANAQHRVRRRNGRRL
jgi:hypothetical protein